MIEEDRKIYDEELEKLFDLRTFYLTAREMCTDWYRSKHAIGMLASSTMYLIKHRYSLNEEPLVNFINGIDSSYGDYYQGHICTEKFLDQLDDIFYETIETEIRLIEEKIEEIQ